MGINNIENISTKLKSNLSDKRYKHCLRIAKDSADIAKHFSYNKEKAYLAGLLHDCAKELSNEELVKLCLDHNLPLGEKDIEEAHQLHGVAGACIAKEQYNIQDKEILIAIANHSGRPDMTPLEKILMIADVFDSLTRKNFNLDYIKKSENLDHALLGLLAPMLEYCITANIKMAERTQDAFDYLLADILKNKYADKNFEFDIEVLSDDGMHNIKYSNLALEEKLFREAIEINREHGINLKSVQNIRDLGGFNTKNGHATKRHKILRSGALTNLSKQDTNFLKNYGITTIIDLRNSYETEKAPDINVDEFNYYNCPLPISNPEVNYYRERMLERKEQIFSKNEDIWYNVQYFASFDMLGMFRDILFDKESIRQIRKIFKIILNNEGGVLFHCTSGKDRTGIISIILLNFLDVKYDDIRADYFTSSLSGLAATESYIVDMLLDGFGSKIIMETKRVLGVCIDSLPAIKNMIEEKYGSVNQYIDKELRLTPKEIEKLTQKFTED